MGRPYRYFLLQFTDLQAWELIVTITALKGTIGTPSPGAVPPKQPMARRGERTLLTGYSLPPLRSLVARRK